MNGPQHPETTIGPRGPQNKDQPIYNVKLREWEVALALAWCEQEGYDGVYRTLCEMSPIVPDHDFDEEIKQEDVEPIRRKFLEAGEKKPI